MKAKYFRLSATKHKLPYQPIVENETYFYRNMKATKISKQNENNTCIPNIIVDTFYMKISLKHSIMFVSLSLANLPSI